jgi:hypothetical protein
MLPVTINEGTIITDQCISTPEKTEKRVVMTNDAKLAKKHQTEIPYQESRLL